jgi:hypothetical protein
VTPTPDHGVEKHAGTVRALTAPGAPLSTESRHATIANPAWFSNPRRPTPIRGRLHNEILTPYRERFAELTAAGHTGRAIVLTGPPGAGKSRILAQLIGKRTATRARHGSRSTPTS